jgi:hypothetical protein
MNKGIRRNNVINKVGLRRSTSDDLDKTAKNKKVKSLKNKAAIANNLISITGTPHCAFLLSLNNKPVSKKSNSFVTKIKLRKFKRPVKYKKAVDSYISIINVDDRMLYSTSTLIHPEGVAFLFHLDGCSKNLLLYLILNKVDLKTCKYGFNQHVVDEFREYASTFFYTEYKNETIKQAHRNLVERNITSNEIRGVYFINPLITGGRSEADRRILLTEYSKHLINKTGVDPKEDIYPIYYKSVSRF